MWFCKSCYLNNREILKSIIARLTRILPSKDTTNQNTESSGTRPPLRIWDIHSKKGRIKWMYALLTFPYSEFRGLCKRPKFGMRPLSLSFCCGFTCVFKVVIVKNLNLDVFKRISKSKRRRTKAYINRINRDAYQKRPHKQRKKKGEFFHS